MSFSLSVSFQPSFFTWFPNRCKACYIEYCNHTRKHHARPSTSAIHNAVLATLPSPPLRSGSRVSKRLLLLLVLVRNTRLLLQVRRAHHRHHGTGSCTCRHHGPRYARLPRRRLIRPRLLLWRWIGRHPIRFIILRIRLLPGLGAWGRVLIRPCCS
jgi:hypothetical protein